MPEWKSKNKFVVLSHKEVVVGETYNHHPYSTAGACTHDEFLGGRYQDLVRSAFSESVLQEIVQAIKSADKNPEFKKQRQIIEQCRKTFEHLPINDDLLDLLKSPETLRASNTYDSDTKSYVVLSPDQKLILKTPNAELLPLNGADPKYVYNACCGPFAGGVFHDGCFYISEGQTVTVLNLKAEPVFQLHDKNFVTWGSNLRVGDIYKNGNTVFFSYVFFDADDAPGLITITENGLASRFEMTERKGSHAFLTPQNVKQ